MGIIKNGILGGISGKVGTVVGSSWKGIQYLRALPSGMSNPRTPGQETTRRKLNVIVKFLRVCLSLIRIGFGSQAIKKSAFNAATSYNFHNGIAGAYPDIDVNYATALLSMGTLLPPEGASAEVTEPGKIAFSWADNSGGENAHTADVAMLLVYNADKGLSVQNLEGGTRESGETVLNVPSGWAGDRVHCYVTFRSPEGMIVSRPMDRVSNSVYAGEVEVL